MEKHDHGHIHLDRPHVDHLLNESVSKLAPYAGLILTICLVIIFLFRIYIFEAFLLERLYGKKYKAMDETVRRGFVNHHVAGTIKVVLLLSAVYPFVDVAFGNATMHSPFAGSKHVTMGDVLVVCSQLFIGMYVFELFYRTHVSPVSVLHHIGAIVIAQSAVAASLDFYHEVDSTIEFILCFVWGAFDVVAEFLPHIAIILYRIYPTEHEFLVKVFRASCFTEFIGTTTETAIVMWLFGSLWSRWTLPFKIITPILHVIFSAAQLWGAIIFRRMWKQQESKVYEKKRESQLPS
ncbi:hypothetical protein BKCO1_7100024 [Neofusicoccum parvum]|uniref:Uncharacterized protein n=1 Tax=Neofusicoccum parvum TaxID=310453 RepID=A0ACB5RXW4_9PEZI|nr:hypothetical protein BKCO1_7100024 [Neofusicoccum parvum]